MFRNVFLFGQLFVLLCALPVPEVDAATSHCTPELQPVVSNAYYAEGESPSVLSLNVRHCGDTHFIGIMLPEEVRLESVSGADCKLAREQPGAICTIDRAAGARETDEVRVEYSVSVADTEALRGDGDEGWWIGWPVRLISERGEVLAEAEQGLTSVQPWVHVFWPSDGQVFTVDPGGLIGIQVNVLANQNFQHATTSITGFTYSHFEELGGVGISTCQQTATDTVRCTGAEVGGDALAQHLVMVFFTAPLSPGSHTGLTVAETCPMDAGSVYPCVSDASLFTVNIENEGVVSATKTGPAQVTVGDTIDWNISVTNSGASDVTNLTITDFLPTGVSFVSATGPGWSCGHSGAIVTCQRAALGAGQTSNITITVTANQVGLASNTCELTGSVGSTYDSKSCNDDVDILDGGVENIVYVSKTGPNTATAGAQFQWEITVTNESGDTVSGVSVVDTLPGGVTYHGSAASDPGWSCSASGPTVTCNGPNLAPGQSSTLRLTASIGSAGTYTNTCTASASGAIVNHTPCSHQVSVDQPEPPNAFPTAAISSAVPAPGPMEQVVYTLRSGHTLGSTCASPHSGTWATLEVLFDPGPDWVGSALDVTFHNIPGWGTAGAGSCSLSENRCNLVNVPCTNGWEDYAPEITAVGHYSQSGTKTASNRTRAHRGGNWSTFVQANVTDTFYDPPQISLDIVASDNDVLAGQTLTYTAQAVIPAGNQGTNTHRIGLTLPASFVLTSGPSGSGASCSAAGGNGYECTYTGSTGSGGRTRTVTFSGHYTAAGSYTVSGSASVNGQFYGSASAVASEPVGVEVLTDLDVVKTAVNTPVFVNQPLEWRIVVTNHGPNDSNGWTLEDTIPDGLDVDAITSPGDVLCSPSGSVVTCVGGALAVGQSREILIETSSDSEGGEFTNISAVFADDDDPDLSNNVSQAAGETVPLASISVDKLTATNQVHVGDSFWYRIVLSNTGPSDAVNVVITDNVPSEFSVDSVVHLVGSSDFDCNFTGNTVVCEADTVPYPTADVIQINVTALSAGETTNVCVLEADTSNDIGDLCEADVEVRDLANLSVSKNASVAQAYVGESFSYELVVINSGPSEAEGVVISDEVPSELVVDSAPGDGPFDCTISGNLVTCSATSLPIGTYALPIFVTAVSEGTITNVCILVSQTDGQIIDNCEVEVEVEASTDLEVTKTVVDSPALAPNPLEWLLTVTNHGPSPSSGWSLDDTIPAGLSVDAINAPAGVTCDNSGSLVICEGDALAVGDSVDISILTNAGTGSGVYTNTCEIFPHDEDPDLTNNACQADGEVIPVANIEVNKISSEDVVLIGDTFTYEIEITNNGPSSAPNVVIVDEVPPELVVVSAIEVVDDGGGLGSHPVFECDVLGNTVTCSANSLSIGTRTIVIEVTAVSPGEITNVCVLTSEAEGDIIDNCEADTDLEFNADLSIDKIALGEPIFAGTTFEYLLTFENAGPHDAEAVVITDTLPSEVALVGFSTSNDEVISCDESGGVVTCVFRENFGFEDSGWVRIEVAAPNEGGDILNTCEIDADTPDPDLSNNACALVTGVIPLSDISVEKSAPAEVDAGAEFTYEIAVSNAGPSTAENVTVSDTLPSEVTFLNVTASAPFSCSDDGGSPTTVTCEASALPVGDYLIEILVQAPDEPTQFGNICVIVSDTEDPNPPQPGDCEDDGTIVNPIAEIEVTKAADPTETYAGSPVEWTLTVVNHGPSTAENVVVEDDVPAGFEIDSVDSDAGSCDIADQVVTCALGSLPPQDVVTITILTTAPAEGGSFTNLCVASSTTPPPSGADPVECDADVEIIPIADLDLDKVAVIVEGDGSLTPISEIGAGETFWYWVTVLNHGPSTAEFVELVDQLPAELTYVGVEATNGTCQYHAADHEVQCVAPMLAAGTTLGALIEVVAPEAAMTITNIAIVDSDTEDPDPEDPVDPELPVTETPAIGAAKALTSVTDLGGGAFQASLLFAARNYGNVPLAELQIYDDFGDTFPPGVAWSLVSMEAVDQPDNTCSALNASFDGLSDIAMLTGTETLPVDGVCWVRLVIDFEPGAEPGPFLNQALAEGYSTLDERVEDLSHDGVDPDPDGSGPENWNDPTPIGYLEDPRIGLAKRVLGVTSLGDGRQTFEIEILVRNYGNTILNDLLVTDNLALTFGKIAGQIDSVSAVTASGAVTDVNPDYDGIDDVNLLSGGDMLSVDGEGALTFSVTIALESGDIGPYMNQAVGFGISPQGMKASDLSQAGIDPNPSETGDPTDDNDPTPLLPLISDLAVSKVLLTEDPVAGGPVTWRLTVMNLGPDDAENVELVDQLPDSVTFTGFDAADGWSCEHAAGVVTCSTSLIESEAVVHLDIHATIGPDGGDIRNTCVISGALPDPNLGNNTCDVPGDGEPVADLQISKSVETDPVYAGEPMLYVITLENLGPSAAESVMVVDELPVAFTFTGVTADAPLSCAESDGVVTCEAALLPVGAYSIEIGGLAPTDLAPFENFCVVAADTSDPSPPGDQDCHDGGVDPEPSAALVVSKRVSETHVAPMGEVTWIIDIENLGPTHAENVTVLDDVPAEFIITSVDASGFECSVSDNQVACIADELPVGQFAIEIHSIVPAVPGPYTNICVVESGTFDPGRPGAGYDCETDVIVSDEGVLMIEATADKPKVYVGDFWTYEVRAQNPGPISLSDVAVDVSLFGPGSQDGDADTNGDPVQCSTNGPSGFGCTLSVLEESGDLVINIRMLAEGQGVHQLTATATTTNSLDPSSVLTAQANVDIDIQGGPDGAQLAIAKSISSTRVNPSESFSWYIDIENRGPDDALDVVLLDDVPGETTVNDVQGDAPFNCSLTGNLVECAADVLPPGSYRIEIMATAPATPGPLVNVCVLDAADFDEDPICEVAGQVVDPDDPGDPGFEAIPIPWTAPWVILLMILQILAVGALTVRRRESGA